MNTSINRRTLAKGAIWSAPVIAVAAPARAVASSCINAPTGTVTSACKNPGNSSQPCGFKTYAMFVSLTNPNNEAVTIQITNATVDGTTFDSNLTVNGQSTFVLDANQSTVVRVDADTQPSSANKKNYTVCLSGTATDSDGSMTRTFTVCGDVSSTPPKCEGC